MSINVIATKVNGFDDCINPGNFYFQKMEDKEYIFFMCPCNICHHIVSLPLNHVNNGVGWNFNSNYDKPSLTPSIKRIDKCKYHGHLTNGIFTGILE